MLVLVDISVLLFIVRALTTFRGNYYLVIIKIIAVELRNQFHAIGQLHSLEPIYPLAERRGAFSRKIKFRDHLFFRRVTFARLDFKIQISMHGHRATWLKWWQEQSFFFMYE